MIEVKKQAEKSYLLKIEEADFLINPAQITSGSYIILTQNDYSLNQNTVFQAPGEYEVKRVYFYGLPNSTFLFQTKEYSLLFAEKEPTKELLPAIKKRAPVLPIVFLTELRNLPFWHKEFGTKVFITENKIKAEGFQINQQKTIKINPRRIEHTIFLLR